MVEMAAQEAGAGEPRRSATRSPAPPRRRPVAAGALMLVAVACGVEGPAAATEDRTPDQRLVAAPQSPPSSYFGASVAMTRGTGQNTKAFVGQVEGPGGAGTAHLFHHEPGSGWRSIAEAAFTGVQMLPVDVELGSGVYAVRLPDGSFTVESFDAFGLGGTELGGLPSWIEAVATAVSLEGRWIAVGVPGAGSGAGMVRVYEASDSGWQLAAELLGEGAGDGFGSALAMQPGLLVVGAPYQGSNGAVHVFVRAEGWVPWQQLDSPATSQSGARFGAEVDVDGDGWIAVGSPLVDRVTSPGARTDVGGVYLYQNVGFGWQLATLLRPPNASSGDRFGASLALDRGVLVAGSPHEDRGAAGQGAAYVYLRQGGLWETLPRLRLIDDGPAPSVLFGLEVAVGEHGALVSAPHNEENGVPQQGAVLFFADVGAFFADGFESGDTAAWSAVAP